MTRVRAALEAARAATSIKQFKHWYPQYGGIFNEIRRINCTDEYNNYLTGEKNQSNINWLAGGDGYTVLTQPLIDCILQHTSEYLKMSMTSAQVMLGIMPTIVALLGPSRDEIAMLANVGRRPLLALALAFASPSAYFSRAFEYSDPAEILSQAENRHKQWRPAQPMTQLLVSAGEYIVAAAACVNVINNTRQIDQWAITSLWSDSDFLPSFWLCLGALLHIFSCVFIPCAASSYAGRIDVFRETKTFLVAAWWESSLTILHLVFGTLIFSGMLFIGSKDAVSIVGRYIAGAAICRVILMYELAGLRESLGMRGLGIKPLFY
ncbi:hypothetical protein EDB81DRAFT_843415 [Dactylonectria macrodidyma]|uniref:Uncharacterized protein n=1 Tax=Dactylonectria macrodidyma TaxID=307937 RepID=A0A9P9J5I1_9HYPO|nr:hypothetical protein EDB81DRAFT_843415 [Dactylonectria macrodidyma]